MHGFKRNFAQTFFQGIQDRVSHAEGVIAPHYCPLPWPQNVVQLNLVKRFIYFISNACIRMKCPSSVRLTDWLSVRPSVRPFIHPSHFLINSITPHRVKVRWHKFGIDILLVKFSDEFECMGVTVTYVQGHLSRRELLVLCRILVLWVASFVVIVYCCNIILLAYFDLIFFYLHTLTLYLW